MTGNNYLQFYLQTNSPPGTPPPAAVALEAALALDPIPLDVRRLRVQHGSKRRRDLAAVRMADELREIETFAAAGELVDAAEVWALALDRLRDALPPSTFGIWIEPLEPVGVAAGTLYLAAPPEVRAWTERRYSRLIGEALAEVSDLERVSFAPVPGVGE